jgi:nitroreductase
VTRYNELRRGDLPPACRFDLGHVAILFELSLGLSAWKSYGANRWALRCNPSSGNLHPTESYLLCPHLPGLSAGIYHYLSRDHLLEQRAAVDDPRWTDVFSGKGILLGISSIYWREAWKYGTRAWRYCQHDCGHAIAAVADPIGRLRRGRCRGELAETRPQRGVRVCRKRSAGCAAVGR